MLIPRKITFLATVTVIPTFIFLLFYHQPETLSVKQLVRQEEINNYKSNTTKYILYYNKMFYNATFFLGEGSGIFKHCPVSDCYATTNKSLMPLDKFHALMFHGNGFKPFSDAAPKVRHRNQYYIWVNMEAPSNSIMFKSTNYFNWSMTYRTDSDLYRPYGHPKKAHRQYIPPTIEDIQQRDSKIAWVVSNCRTHGKRDILYKAINKLMAVDVFGRCGTKVCPHENDDCFTSIAKKYKFYLSFENSICRDYVTEKFFRTLQYDIVPIVYGGANYTNLAPPHSFIDVNDFESVEHLVRYLEKLDKNPQMYLEYFKWKKDFVIDESNDDVLCVMCKKLHGPLKPQYYEDITDWYNQKDICRFNKQLPKIVADLI